MKTLIINLCRLFLNLLTKHSYLLLLHLSVFNLLVNFFLGLTHRLVFKLELLSQVLNFDLLHGQGSFKLCLNLFLRLLLLLKVELYLCKLLLHLTVLFQHIFVFSSKVLFLLNKLELALLELLSFHLGFHFLFHHYLELVDHTCVSL